MIFKLVVRAWLAGSRDAAQLDVRRGRRVKVFLGSVAPPGVPRPDLAATGRSLARVKRLHLTVAAAEAAADGGKAGAANRCSPMVAAAAGRPAVAGRAAQQTLVAEKIQPASPRGIPGSGLLDDVDLFATQLQQPAQLLPPQAAALQQGGNAGRLPTAGLPAAQSAQPVAGGRMSGGDSMDPFRWVRNVWVGGAV